MKYHRAALPADIRHAWSPPQKTNPKRGENAFTLTDLLALIAAGAFFCILILPCLAGPADQSSRTKCFNNLRQLGQAMLMYASDNNDYLAYPNWASDRGLAGWLYTASVSGFPPDPTTPPFNLDPVAAYKTGLWFKYTQTTNCYVCPVDAQSRFYRQRPNKLSSYIMNGAVCGYGTAYPSRSICKIGGVWNSECYLLWEPDEYMGSPPIGAFAFNDGSSYPDWDEGIGRLHSPTSGYVLSVSGNARSVTYREFSSQQTSAGRSLAWWSPLTSNGR